MTVWFGWDSADEFTLKFSNSVIYLKDRDESLELYWKQLFFKYNYILNQDDILLLDKNNIRISNCIRMKISHFTKEIEDTTLKLNTLSLIDSKYDNFCIASIDHLKEIRINLNNLLILLENINNKKYFPTLSFSTKFVVSLDSMYEFLKFEEVNQFVPQHWELTLKDTYNYAIIKILNHCLK